jgi:Icc-related predicted phosphoesterase
MPRVSAATLALALLVSAALPARADEESASLPSTFDVYQEEYEAKCVGPADGRLARPQEYERSGFRYALEGARVKVTRTSARKAAGAFTMGVVNAIKDDAPDTRQNLDDYLAKFAAADVDAIVVGGDTAFDETEIASILGRLAAMGVPVYAIIGNQENRGSWNRALRETFAKFPNVLNLDFVRVVDADGFDLVSLPGYYDKRYTHQSGACVYQPDDAKALPALAAGLDGPVVLLSHGPPRQAGKLALDYVPNAGNVGDEAMTAALVTGKIPFGIFGHVLEAGGRATDLSGRKEIRPGALVDALYLNPGSANSLPWRMNVGPESYGMASILTFQGRKAKFELLRSPRRAPTGE